MMGSDEYELVPKGQLDTLRGEVNKLKHTPLGHVDEGADLHSSIEELNKNIARLVNILQSASDEVVRDYRESAHHKKIDQVVDQNEKLAKGIVAIADLVRDMKENTPPIPDQSATAEIPPLEPHWSEPPAQVIPQEPLPPPEPVQSPPQPVQQDGGLWQSNEPKFTSGPPNASPKPPENSPENPLFSEEQHGGLPPLDPNEAPPPPPR